MPQFREPPLHGKRVMGTETEYSLFQPNGSSWATYQTPAQLVVSYVRGVTAAPWHVLPNSTSRDDMSLHTADGFALTNGSRFYVDHTHPEFCTPEVMSAHDAVVWEKAGERILDQARVELELLDGTRVLIHKNNTDRRVSYGHHINLQGERKVATSEYATALVPFLVSQVPIAGSGVIMPNGRGDGFSFWISQRAIFMEQQTGIHTTRNRPIYNTRDVAYADTRLHRRLHVIVGDSNLSEVQTLVKIGSLELATAATEAGLIPLSRVEMEHPVQSIKTFARDTSLQVAVPMLNGSRLTALDIQEIYWQACEQLLRTFGGTPAQQDVLRRWRLMLDGLRSDPMSQAHTLDWVAKHLLLMGYTRRGLGMDDPRMLRCDISYHDLDPTRGLYLKTLAAGRMDRLFEHPADSLGGPLPDTEALIHRAISMPPTNTRAWLRGQLVERYGSQPAEAGAPAMASQVVLEWDAARLQSDQGTALFLPMSNPIAQDQAELESAIADVADSGELVRICSPADGRLAATFGRDPKTRDYAPGEIDDLNRLHHSARQESIQWLRPVPRKYRRDQLSDPDKRV